MFLKISNNKLQLRAGQFNANLLTIFFEKTWGLRIFVFWWKCDYLSSHPPSQYPSNPFGEHIPSLIFSEIVYYPLSPTQDYAHHLFSLQLSTAKKIDGQLATLTRMSRLYNERGRSNGRGEYFTICMAFSCYFATVLSLTLSSFLKLCAKQFIMKYVESEKSSWSPWCMSRTQLKGQI